MITVTKEQIENWIKGTTSMAQACVASGLHSTTFKRYAIKYGLYNTNQGAKGSSKPKREGNGKFLLNEILEGNHPQYSTGKLKHRLYAEGIKKNVCEECGVDSWNDKPLVCEMDHIDGNCHNHLLNNLRILCPNCHSQTPTFRFKKRI